MHSRQLLALLLLLSTIDLQAAVDCVLPEDYIKTSNRIFLLKDANGHYKLLLRDSVPERKRLYLICNAARTTIVQCNANGTWSHALPVFPCELTASVWRITNDTVGFPNYDKYEVGFNVGGDLLVLYRVVYSALDVRAMYSSYEGYTSSIKTRRPKQSFLLNNTISGEAAQSFANNDIYHRFISLFGNNRYIRNNRTSIIQRGHLSPSADFLFEQDMRATFKYLNVVPQFASINRRNWAKIETWVRKHSGTQPIPYSVLTGGYDVLELQHPTTKVATEVYLFSGDKNPVPKWIYKLVQKQGHCTAFVTYNNIYDDIMATPICTEINCPQINLINNKTHGFTYCCNKTDLQRVLNINFC